MKEFLTSDQIQTILDHFSVGKLLSHAQSEKINLLVHEQPISFKDVLSREQLRSEQYLEVIKLVVTTTQGVFLLVSTDPNQEHKVFVGNGNWAELLYKRLQLKNIQPVAQSMEESIFTAHKFDHYFYLFAL